MAMKTRGDKFFEAGSNEMGTYRKMIVRDLGNFPVPEKIQVCIFSSMYIYTDIYAHMHSCTYTYK